MAMATNMARCESIEQWSVIIGFWSQSCAQLISMNHETSIVGILACTTHVWRAEQKEWCDKLNEKGNYEYPSWKHSKSNLRGVL